MREQIISLLDSLRLRGAAACVEQVLNNAEQQGIATSDVLLELLEAEHRDQRERCLENRVKHAKIPWPWTLDTFPFKQQPGVHKAQIMSLAQLNFIERNENIIFIGEPGTGKSGLAMGLLRLALLNGYRGRFYNAQALLDELYASLADRTTSKVLTRLCNYDILLIDELGYLTLTTEQSNIFFKLIDLRYQKKSTMITSNLHFKDWYTIFKHKELVDAMLDRFKHHCTMIHIVGPTLREPQSSITPSKKEHVEQKVSHKEEQGPE